jgi:hypothetical protein
MYYLTLNPGWLFGVVIYWILLIWGIKSMIKIIKRKNE